MRHASQAITEFYDRVLAPSGLKITQYSLLRELDLGGSASISELAERVDLDRTTMGRNLHVLAEDELISFSPGQDRRERMVQMTGKGRRSLAIAYPLWEQAQNTLTSALGHEQVDALKALLLTLESAAS